MKKLIVILFLLPLFCSSQDVDYSQYLTDIAWSTELKNVTYLGTDTFSVEVKPLDTREPGARPLLHGNYLMDNRGFRYEIIDTTSSPMLTVVDILPEIQGYAPANNKIGFVYQSAGHGESNSIATLAYKKLQESAFEYGYSLDMNILWGQLASKKLLATRIGTSIHWGGEITVNAGDPTKFDIAAGSGHIANNYTDPENPINRVITWEDQTITDEGIGIRNLTFISIDTFGNVVQDDAALTNEERRDFISIGTNLIGASSILSTANVVSWNADIFLTFVDFVDAIGSRFNIEGNIYSPNDGNQKINRSAGKMFGIGLNYKDNKKDVNVPPSIDQSGITFFAAYRGGGSNPAIVEIIDTIPTSMYDPNGDGTLVTIPEGYCVVHRIDYDPVTNATALQYAQFAYDSQKKAVDSYDKEDFDEIDELKRVPLRCYLVICKGVTDLSERDNATFINVNTFGDEVNDHIPHYADFAEGVELLDGMSYKQQSIYFTDDGVNVFLEVERNPIYGGGDMIYILGQREFTLDCTTGSGVGGRAKIQLLLGSDGNARLQYIYVTRLGEETVQLNISESKPTGEYAMLWRGSLRSYAKYVEDGMKPFTTQRYTQAKEKDGISMIITAAEKLRAQGAETSASYGPVPLIEIVQDNPDSVNFIASAGGVYQFYYQIFQSLSSKVDGIRVLNPHANETFGALDYINNLANIEYDAAGNTLNNRSFNFVFVGAKNSANGDSIDWLGVLLPSNTYTYNSTESAIANLGGYAVTYVPSEADQVAFLQCRVSFRYKNGQWENLTLSETGLNYFDLRGQPLGTTSGGTGTPSPTPVFDDNTFEVLNASDPTKIIKLDASNISTGTIRTYTVPDVNDTIAVRGDLHPELTLTGEDYAQLDVPNQIINFDQIEQSQVVGLVDTISDHRTDIDQNAGLTWQDVVDNGTAFVTNPITTGGATINGLFSNSYTDDRTSARPVIFDVNYIIDPSASIVSATDYHGIDITFDTGSSNVNANVGLYPFESRTRYGGTGTLGRAVGMYSTIQNESSGTLIDAVGLQLRAYNNSTGTMHSYMGTLIYDPVNGGGGDIVNAYGIYINDITTATNDNYGIYSLATNYFARIETPSTSLVDNLNSEYFNSLLSERFVFGGNSSASTLSTDLNSITKSGFYSTTPSSTNAPTADYYHVTHNSLYNNAGFYTQTATLIYTNITYSRVYNGVAWSSWVISYNTGNFTDNSTNWDAAYDHSQVITGNPHDVNATDVGLGNVENAAASTLYEPIIATGTTLQYWSGDKTFQTLNTSIVPELTNLYYTEGRVDANTNVATNTSSRHDAVTLGTANGLSLSTQQLSLGLSSTSTTGALSDIDWDTFNEKLDLADISGKWNNNGTSTATGDWDIGAFDFDAVNGNFSGLVTTNSLNVDGSTDGNYAAIIKNSHATNGHGLRITAGDDVNSVVLLVTDKDRATNFLTIKGDGNSTFSGPVTAASFTATSGEIIDEFSGDVNLTGDASVVPNVPAVKAYVDAIPDVAYTDVANQFQENQTITKSRAGSALSVNNPSGSGTGVFSDAGFIGVDARGGIYDVRMSDSGVLNISNFAAAPATATSTGTKGTVIITATHIYVCSATNTWVRTALTTW